MTAGPPDSRVLPRVAAIYRDAATMYRVHFGVIAGSAAIVLVPFAILDGLGFLTYETSSTRPVAAVIVVMLAAGTSGMSGLASIFYAGFLDHTAAAWHDDADAPSYREVARRLPWRQLVIASVVAYAVEIVGLLAFVVPGLVLYGLFILTGPILVSEDLGAFAALRRSASLVRRNPALVTIAVIVPLLLEGAAADFVGVLLGHDLIVEIGAEVVITLVLASFLGVVEVITAHHLQQAHPPSAPRASGW